MTDIEPTKPEVDWDMVNVQLQKLLTQDGLYSSMAVEDFGPFLGYVQQGSILKSFDLFCPFCKMVTTYQIRSGSSINRATQTRYSSDPARPQIIVLSAVCLRANHLISYVLHETATHLTKIGQTPSVADIAFGELKDISRALDRGDREELGRALSLFAQDAPLGAFVYLRRVFERMILRAHGRHVAAGHPAIDGFADMPMDKRIREIREQLPPRVVQHRAVFQILSKGIHEFADEEARVLFPLVKTIIFQMLGDEERLRLAAKQEAATTAEFDAVLRQLGGKVKPSLIEHKSFTEGEDG